MCLSPTDASNAIQPVARQVPPTDDQPMQFIIEMHQHPTRILIKDPLTGAVLADLDEASSRSLLAESGEPGLGPAAATLASKVTGLLKPASPLEPPPPGTASQVLEEQFSAAEQDPPRKTRRKLWDLAHRLHCPVIGTCLDASELRRVAQKAGARPAGELSDYDVHVSFVAAADDKNILSLAAHKALEKKFARQVKRFAGAKTRDRLTALWEESLARGDVPGGLWATLTHPRCDDALKAAVVCATDSVSHDAYYRLKRFCKKAEKPHVFMRSSGMSAFTRAIYGVAGSA